VCVEIGDLVILLPMCHFVGVAEWNTPAVVAYHLHSSIRQSSSLFDVSSLPQSQHKSLSFGLFGGGDDSFVSKSGGKFYTLLAQLIYFAAAYVSHLLMSTIFYSPQSSALYSVLYCLM